MNQENHNNYAEISELRHEIGVNQKDPNFDFLFKIITIGDPGNSEIFVKLFRKWKIMPFESFDLESIC